jgi:hypothetical protein
LEEEELLGKVLEGCLEAVVLERLRLPRQHQRLEEVLLRQLLEAQRQRLHSADLGQQQQQRLSKRPHLVLEEEEEHSKLPQDLEVEEELPDSGALLPHQPLGAGGILQHLASSSSQLFQLLLLGLANQRRQVGLGLPQQGLDNKVLHCLETILQRQHLEVLLELLHNNNRLLDLVQEGHLNSLHLISRVLILVSF